MDTLMLSCIRNIEVNVIGGTYIDQTNFLKTFILDVEWSIKGVGAIYSQENGKQKQVIAYANKSLMPLQKHCHPMEGECYALIWGIMHFKQFLHQTFFLLPIDHEPLEWLMIVCDVNEKRGRWISMLQDFHFKIVHHPGNKHFNVDALNKNPMFVSNENEDFQGEVLNQVVFVSKNAMKDGIQFMINNSKFHEMPNLFTLSKVTDDLLLETTKEKYLVMKCHELALGGCTFELLPICANFFFIIIDYEQMVMEVQ